jgi:hypothetical protein
MKDNKELTKAKSKKEKRIRISRPMGVTVMAKEYNEARSDNNPIAALRKNTITKRYIQALLNNELIEYDSITKDYKPISTNKLALILGMNEYELMVEISKQMSKAGILFDRHKADVARGLTMRLIFLGSELSALTSQQVSILMASQGNKYKPFISGEVNRAIANKIASSKPMLDLLKLLTDKQSSTLSLPSDSLPSNTTDGQILTVEMAHNMLNQGLPTVMNDDATRATILANSADLKLLPETNPNFQGGDILRSASLYKGQPEDLDSLPIPDKSRRTRGITEVEDEDEFRA